MGLDVYLRYFPNGEADALREEAYDCEWDKLQGGIWARYAGSENNKMPDDRRSEYEVEIDAARERLLVQHGMSVGKYGEGQVPGKMEVDEPSAIHPEHLFKIGYWRSAYNDSGVNHILREFIGKSLYDLLGDKSKNVESGTLFPNWVDMRERAGKLLADFRLWAEKHGGVQVERIGVNMFNSNYIRGAREALEAYDRVMESNDPAPFLKGENRDFDCKDGRFYPGGHEVLALIPGVREDHFIKDVHLIPTVYVISKGHGYGWYVEALEIVVETCNWVLSKPDPEHYGQVWSG
jgi:hypothetical protein